VPSLFLTSARIWTGDPAKPWAQAAAIEGGRFAWAGDAREANAPSSAETFDAGGRLVVPGLTDGHAHLLTTGYAMQSVDLKGVTSLQEAVRRVGEGAAAAAPGAWVQGAGWDQHEWPGARFPTRHDLDAVAPEHPVLLNHTSGHCIWVNTAALRAAGITAETTAPAGGAIDIGDDGELTGILRDNASRLVAGVVPHPSPPERLAALEAALAHAHRLGVTGAHAMNVGRGEYQAMLALHDSGRLRFRTRVFLTADRLDEWFDRGIQTGDGDDMLRIGGVKFFADGALGSMTAWMLEPFEGSDDTGLPLQSAAELEEQVRRCLEGRLTPAIHAIGDRANREVLDILDRARDIGRGLPRRIEHAQLLTEADVGRFTGLGVTASAQPIHATQDMTKVDRSWGPRGRWAYVFETLRRSGANLAFGSDTPVETMDPLAGIHAAVTRQRRDGTPPGGWYPAERLAVDEAVRAYTSGCASAVGEQGFAGRIAQGYLGDFTVLSANVVEIPPAEIADVQATATVVGGDVVYVRDG
jgi:predicted amidohydrolase YtcJ